MVSSSAPSRSEAGVDPARLLEQPIDLVPGQHPRQLCPGTRWPQLRGGIGIDDRVATQMPVEGPQTRDLALERRRRRGPAVLAAARQLADERRQVLPIHPERIDPSATEELAELGQVGAVGVERVPR